MTTNPPMVSLCNVASPALTLRCELPANHEGEHEGGGFGWSSAQLGLVDQPIPYRLAPTLAELGGHVRALNADAAAIWSAPLPHVRHEDACTCPRAPGCHEPAIHVHAHTCIVGCATLDDVRTAITQALTRELWRSNDNDADRQATTEAVLAKLLAAGVLR